MLDKQCLICYPHEIKIYYYYTNITLTLKINKHETLDVCNGSFFTIIVLLVVLLFVDLLIVESMFCLIY